MEDGVEYSELEEDVAWDPTIISNQNFHQTFFQMSRERVKNLCSKKRYCAPILALLGICVIIFILATLNIRNNDIPQYNNRKASNRSSIRQIGHVIVKKDQIINTDYHPMLKKINPNSTPSVMNNESLKNPKVPNHDKLQTPNGTIQEKKHYPNVCASDIHKSNFSNTGMLLSA